MDGRPAHDGCMMGASNTGVLRLAHAHRPVFYLPHLVAHAVGALRRRSLTVELVPMETSGQWDLLVSGSADLAIGGPMRSMRLLEDGYRLVSFAAAVSTSPWVLIGHSEAAAVPTPQEVVGRTLLDDPDVATARLCLRGLLAAGGGAGHQPLKISMCPRSAIVRRIAAGSASLGLVPYEAIADSAERDRVRVVAELATWIGRVPWSSYQALPQLLDRRRVEVAAFADAIEEALPIIAVEPREHIADLVAPWFPRLERATLEAAIGSYQRIGVWATTTTVPRDEFDRFGSLLRSAGWLREMPPYEELVEVVSGG